MSQLANTFGMQAVVPYLDPEKARETPINIPPGVTILAGTILGQITGSANDVQTVSDVPTITAGTFTMSGVNPLTQTPFTTAAIAYNAANSAVKAAVELAASLVGPAPTITMGGGALPGTDMTLTFGGNWANMPVALMTINSAGLTGGTLSVAKTTVGRSLGTYKAYANGNSDGSEDAKLIMKYTVTSDAQGFITFGPAATGGSRGEVYRDCPAWRPGGGVFKTSELVGLDAAGIVDLGAKLISGTVADGLLQI